MAERKEDTSGERQKQRQGEELAWTSSGSSQKQGSFGEETGRNVAEGCMGQNMENLKQKTSPIFLGKRT